jgi:hypothetical protein
VIGVVQAEGAIGASELPDRTQGVRVGGPRRQQGREEPREVLLAQRPHQVVLVLEVVVDRGGGVLDGLRDASHGDLVVALAREQVPGRVEDLAPDLLALPFSPFHRSHPAPSIAAVTGDFKDNDVKLWTNVPSGSRTFL